MKRIKNGISELSANIKNYFKRVKEEHLINEYLKNNIIFLTFAITCILNATVLRFFCMPTLENIFSMKAILADSAIVILIGALGYLIKPKNRFNYYMFFEVFLSAICMINSVYYTFYTSFASISMLSLTQYIGDVGDAVVENVIQLKDLVYVIGPILLFIVHFNLKKKNYYKKVEVKSERKKEQFKL